MFRATTRILWSLASPFLLAAVLPGRVEAQQLRAAYVHGDAVLAPFIVEETTALPGCLWFHTYNQHLAEAVAPPDGTPTVIISFFTEESWPARVVRDGTVPLAAQLDLASFHIRVAPTPPGVRPVVYYRKAAGLGPFVPRGSMPLAGEYYLARLGIPTRLDSASRPVVRQFTDAEVAEARAAVPFGIQGGPCALRTG
jgi:hypothetical protein